METATRTAIQLYPITPLVITRSYTHHVRSTFLFLDLPAEIRNLIYEFVIDVTPAQRLIDRYYHECKVSAPKTN